MAHYHTPARRFQRPTGQAPAAATEWVIAHPESSMKPVLPVLSVLFLSAALAVAATDARASDASVKSRLDARGMKYEIDGDGDYKVTYNYAKEGRTQLVFVSGGTEEVGGFRIREVFSPAGRVEKDDIDGAKALELLAESRKNKLGSWEIAGDVLYFVAKLPDDLDAKELESVMDIVAETADNMELEISGDRDDL